jgi:poly(hydroxyalkanoate) granule-associated protein
MLKKAKGAGAAGAPQDIAKAVLDSSHHVWLAGVGAFARAQEEGTKFFDKLVRQGESIERMTRQVAADTAAAARGAASAKAKEMQEMAGGTWDKLEQVFEERVERALGKLGVYTQSDVRKLADRVDALSAAVNELLKARGAKPIAPRKAAPAAKPAAKPARRRKGKAAKKAAGK